tara:strand:+ start:1155 stop:1427 length:273 start_codon:yes stop_codon:yes gene_type:complete
MMIIEVHTPAFSGRFLHSSEVSSALVLQARFEATSLIGELTNFLKLCLVDQSQIHEFDELKLSEALDVWKAFHATQPTRLEIPNAVPAWL